MTSRHVFVVDDAVLNFFSGRSPRERAELLRVFAMLAENPYQKGDWRRRTKSGRELEVKRIGKWLVSFWLDDPVLEVRVVEVEKLVL